MTSRAASTALLLAVAVEAQVGQHGLLASPFNLGFEPVPLNRSCYRVPLAVNGTLPDFLRGTLYRGAPGAWPDGWWLDGLLTINAFKFEAGKVFFTMQWNKDEAYNRTVQSKPAAPSLERPPVPGGLRHPANTSWPTGVAFHQVQGNLVSSTGVSNINSIDFDTLEPLELPFAYSDDLGAPFLAPTHDSTVDGHVLHHLTTGVQKNSGGTTGYVVTSIKPGTRKREVVARIDRPNASSWKGLPSFQHMPLATAEYYIMLESNCYYPDSVTAVGEVDWTGWQSNPLATAHVRVVSRATGESFLYPLAYNIFAIHHINAYKDASTNSLVVDTIQLFPSEVPCSMAFRGTKLSVLKTGAAGVGYSMSKPLRLVLPLDRPGTKVQPKPLTDASGMEFPTIRYDEHNGKPYKYAYGNWMFKKTAPFYDSIIKINVETGEHVHWHVEGHYPGEPVFVADPNGAAEDDGVIMTNVLDTQRKETYLLVLDARTMMEMSRAGPTPHTIPHGFHGRYFDGPDAAKASREDAVWV
eukprot:TRINITY_DN66273_c0_g1_i1.p1 TRINITY_DN66273_c0_g1~~TRINITY_DN66273_c0_g1_i1.p1  ORF type:complete len:531 (-),score=68.34 TRINITY_DN66273_c0_g1_i1:363-1934(-)